MNNDDEDILREFQHSMDKLKGHLHIMENSVSVEGQIEYFRFSKAVKNDKEMELIPIEDQILAINTPETSITEKKYYLVTLAGSTNVAAYRALESYAKYPDPELADWSALALMEARISLEAELSDEKQIFISTGLGGRNGKLRFFALLSSNKLKVFSDYQKELMEREFPFFLEKHNGEIETLEIKDNYITLVFLANFSIDIQNVLIEAANECNQYGNFLDDRILLTNVKKYNEEEIARELKKRRNENGGF